MIREAPPFSCTPTSPSKKKKLKKKWIVDFQLRHQTIWEMFFYFIFEIQVLKNYKFNFFHKDLSLKKIFSGIHNMINQIF